MEGTVQQIMTKKVLTLAPDADLSDAAWGLTLKGISGAPVKDANGHVLGVISKSDLANPGRTPPSAKHETVADAMTPLLFAIRSTDSLMDAVRRMVETGAHRLVVVDENGQLAGIVTPMDVLKEMVRRAGKQLAERRRRAGAQNGSEARAISPDATIARLPT